MHDQIERNFFDPRQPTKGSLIELGLEILSSLQKYVFLLSQLHEQNSTAWQEKLIPNNSR